MPDHPENDASGELDAVAERASFASARRHVGAAGFAQRDALEHIIAAGREQIVFTESLRQVVASTLTQLRATPLARLGEDAQTHVAALEGIVTSGRAQLETARALRLTIQRVLTEVRGTPLEHVSAHVLTTLSEAVRRQASELEDIIQAAVGEASTVEQIAKLERISAEAYTRLVEVEHGRAEQELTRLDLLGAQALERIQSLEQGGQTHAAHKAQLEREAETSRQRIAVLEGAETRNLAEITQLEWQGEASRARVVELEQAAVNTKERIEGLRRSLESQGRRERALKRDANRAEPPTEPRE